VDKNIPLGIRLDNPEHIGYTAKLWKIVEVDGVEVEKTLTNTSNYRASAAVGVIGTKGATEEELKIINEVLATKDDILIRDTILGLRAPATDDTQNPSGGTTGDGTSVGGGTDTGSGNTPGGDSTDGGDANTGDGTSTGDVNGESGTPTGEN
jgi:hypothetical protein